MRNTLWCHIPYRFRVYGHCWSLNEQKWPPFGHIGSEHARYRTRPRFSHHNSFHQVWWSFVKNCSLYRVHNSSWLRTHARTHVRPRLRSGGTLLALLAIRPSGLRTITRTRFPLFKSFYYEIRPYFKEVLLCRVWLHKTPDSVQRKLLSIIQHYSLPATRASVNHAGPVAWGCPKFKHFLGEDFSVRFTFRSGRTHPPSTTLWPYIQGPVAQKVNDSLTLTAH